MSDRSHEPRPSQSTQDQGEWSTSTSNRPSTGEQRAQRSVSSAATFPAQQQWQTGSGHQFELPPIPQIPGAPPGNVVSSGSRLASVSSILNLPEDDEGPHGRRRKISELESPLSSTSVPTLQNFKRNSPQLMPGSLPDRQPRRILTPRSPSLHRAASASSLNQNVQGTIDAHRSPFLVPRSMNAVTVEPGTSGVPPLPNFPPSMRATAGHSGPAAPIDSMQRTSSAKTHDTEQTSASMSPEMSYSRYSHAERPSPDAQYSSGPPYSTAPATSLDTSPIGQERARPAGIPISSSGGPNVYQMMTLETTSGTVQLPVDVQAASRVADEKRRRNAGASARFRQRRKEKEKEASTTISRLEQQLKDAAEDLEFYRRERDHLANMLLQTPAGDRHFPRPQSPRVRRPSLNYGGSGSGYEMDDEPPSPDEYRSVRRRTSTMSIPPPPPRNNPQSAALGPATPYPNVYAPPYGGMPGLQQHPHQQPPHVGRLSPPMPRRPTLDLPPQTSSLPGIQQQQQQQQHPYQHQQPLPGPQGASRAPQVMQASPQTGPWNPYAAERGARHPPGSHNEGGQ